MFTVDLSSANRVSHTDVYKAFTQNITEHENLVVVTHTNDVSPICTDRFGVLFTRQDGAKYKATAVWERTTPSETTPWIDIWANEVENFGLERTGDPLTDKYLAALEPITSTTIEAHKQPGHDAYHWANQIKPILNYLDTPATYERY